MMVTTNETSRSLNSFIASQKVHAPVRNQALDVLRTVAVLGVFGCHLVYAGGPETASRLAWVWGNVGWSGVDLFFVLSGFLVSGLLFSEFRRTGSINVGRFLLRRGLKIYPAFYVYTAVVLAWTVSVKNRTMPLDRLLSECLFVQNYVPGLWTEHTWSLAVEEHFYVLLLVVFVILAARRSIHAIPAIVLTTAVTALLARIATVSAIPEISCYTHHYPTHLRIDSLAFGVLLRYWHDFYPDSFMSVARRWRGLLAALCFVGVVPAIILPQSHPFIETVGLTLLYLGYGALLMTVVGNGLPDNACTSWAARIGRYSYSIYLWHMVVLAWIMPWFERVSPVSLSFWQYSALYIPLAIGVGIVMSMLVELPVLRMRDHLWPTSDQRNQQPQFRHF